MLAKFCKRETGAARPLCPLPTVIPKNVFDSKALIARAKSLGTSCSRANVLMDFFDFEMLFYIIFRYFQLGLLTGRLEIFCTFNVIFFQFKSWNCSGCLFAREQFAFSTFFGAQGNFVGKQINNLSPEFLWWLLFNRFGGFRPEEVSLGFEGVVLRVPASSLLKQKEPTYDNISKLNLPFQKILRYLVEKGLEKACCYSHFLVHYAWAMSIWNWD